MAFAGWQATPITTHGGQSLCMAMSSEALHKTQRVTSLQLVGHVVLHLLLFPDASDCIRLHEHTFTTRNPIPLKSSRTDVVAKSSNQERNPIEQRHGPLHVHRNPKQSG
jgi:hypothetical protein